MRRLHVFSDFFQHSLLRTGGFERQHGFDSLANSVVQLECDTGLYLSFGALQRQAALEPEELFEDQPPLCRSAKGIEHPKVGTWRWKVQGLNRGPAARP